MVKNKYLLTGGILYTSSLFAQQPPNIIFILADDMRGSTPAFLNKEKTCTPELDSLAKDCTVFTNAHIMGGTSAAVSMPSRAMLMTGKYLYGLEKQGSTIPSSHMLIGEVLREAGYETFHTGKWHNGKESFNRCFDSGKDIFFGGMADHWNVPLFNYDINGQYENKRRVIKDPQKNNQIEILEGEYSYSGKHSVDIFTDAAIEFIKNHTGREKPFFLSLAYMSPHDPRSMPDSFKTRFNFQEMELPDNFMEQHPFDNGELSIRDEVLATIPRNKEEIKKHIAEYYAMISHLDTRIGDVVRTLKTTGMYDRTIIIFAADNGLAVGQHGLLGKQNVYEHSVNVPLMIKNATEKAMHKTTHQLCYLIDIFPTVCEWIGQAIPASVDGLSLQPVLDNDRPIRQYLYFGYRDYQRSVSDGEWKLIEYNVKGIRTTQLFHIKEDPLEMHNLFPDKKYAAVTTKLREQMLQLAKETGDHVNMVSP
jgi:arylsulfatase A-like enzyme